MVWSNRFCWLFFLLSSPLFAFGGVRVDRVAGRAFHCLLNPYSLRIKGGFRGYWTGFLVCLSGCCLLRFDLRVEWRVLQVSSARRKEAQGNPEIDCLECNNLL